MRVAHTKLLLTPTFVCLLHCYILSSLVPSQKYRRKNPSDFFQLGMRLYPEIDETVNHMGNAHSLLVALLTGHAHSIPSPCGLGTRLICYKLSTVLKQL